MSTTGCTVPGTEAYGAQSGRFPHAERRAAMQLSLPIHPYLSDADANFVAELVRELDGARV